MNRSTSFAAFSVPIILSLLIGACGSDGPASPPRSRGDVAQVRVVAGNISVAMATDVLTAGSVALLPGAEAFVRIEFLDRVGNPIVPLAGEFLQVEIADPTVGEWRPDAAGGFEGHLRGLMAGTTTIRFKLMSGTVGSGDAVAVFVPLAIDLIVG